MTENEKNQIVSIAFDNDIEVRWARIRADAAREGVHILNPTYEDVLNALKQAMTHGVKMVVIHDHRSWIDARRGLSC